MTGLEDVHDDEIRARLGMKPVDRPETMEERIEANMVRAMPEATPSPEIHPAWVVGPGPEESPTVAAMSNYVSVECGACHAKTLDWAGKEVYTCWVCGRWTAADGTLLPRPEPGPDEEYTPR